MNPFLYYNHSHVLHASKDPHPECPERVAAIVRKLEPYVKAGKINQKTYDINIPEESAELPTPSWDMADGDTYETPYTKDILSVSDRMIRDAVDDITSGRTDVAFVLCRPPGHHAADSPAGFCHRNNAWTAVNALRDSGFEHVSIYDWDAHHGDGTQKLVERHNLPGVRFASSHAFGLGVYPRTGAAEQTHNVLNVPLPVDTRGDVLIKQFEKKILPFLTADRKPDVFVISAGYDGHVDDPMRLLRFQTWLYEILATTLRDTGIPVLFLLEGGYNPTALAASVEATLKPWLTTSYA